MSCVVFITSWFLDLLLSYVGVLLFFFWVGEIITVVIFGRCMVSQMISDASTSSSERRGCITVNHPIRSRYSNTLVQLGK
jgi:hypothetical protein